MHFSLNVCFIFSLLSLPLSYALTFPLSVPGIFSSACNVDVRWFPFDVQHCELKFGSWTFDGWLLDLQMQEADLSGYMSNGEWELLGERALSAPDPGCPSSFTLPLLFHPSCISLSSILLSNLSLPLSSPLL